LEFHTRTLAILSTSDHAEQNNPLRQFLPSQQVYWFRLGVDGLRLDAVPYLYEQEGTIC